MADGEISLPHHLKRIVPEKRPLRIPKGCILSDDGEMPFPQFMCWDRERPRWRVGSPETGFWAPEGDFWTGIASECPV